MNSVIADYLDYGVTTPVTGGEPWTDHELGTKLAVASSERRIIQLGMISIATETAPDLSIGELHEDYTDAIPGISPFYQPSNLLLDLSRVPDDRVMTIAPAEIPAEARVSLTPEGQKLTTLGGGLLDLSFRHNFPLRVMLGNNHHTPKTPESEQVVTTAERHLMLAALLSKKRNWKTTREMIDADPVDILTMANLDNVLPAWETEGVLQREKIARNGNAWRLTRGAFKAFKELGETLHGHLVGDEAVIEKNEKALREYLVNPQRRSYLPALFRRDYLRTNSKESARVEKMARNFRFALADYEPGTIIETPQLNALVGSSLSTKGIHRLVWWMGAGSPIVLDSIERNRLYWRVTDQRPSRHLSEVGA